MMRRVAVAVVLVVLLSGCVPKPVPDTEGSYYLVLPEGCRLWLFTPESHMGRAMITLACPGVDPLRLYPWPHARPWDAWPDDDPGPEPTEVPGPAPLI